MSARWSGARRAVAVLLSAVALLLQVNAPVHAALMQVVGPDETALCSEHQTSAPDRKAPPARHETCAACVVCSSATPALTPVAIVPPALSIAAAPAPQIAREVAPRGPPGRTAQARAPPLSA